MPHKILIAAGGTGGHIYPALAIADAFVKKQPGVEIAFVGTPTGLENKIIPEHGFPLHHLPIGRLNSNVSLRERLTTLCLMPLAFFKSWRVLGTYRPDFVLGVGGHASGPLLLIAALFGYRTGIWEPNAMPGLANRLLARFVDDCWVVFTEAKRHLKSQHVHLAGMPVRQEIEDMQLATARSDSHIFRVLVFGGSQGARTLNTVIQSLLNEGGAWLKQVEFVHQTGSADFQRIRDSYEPNVPVDVREYLHDMAEQYRRADLVICRSGTGTLSELAACSKAAILVPLPTAADDHQVKNALSLVNKGAAVMILQKNLTPESLRQQIQELIVTPSIRHQLELNIRQFHQPLAAEKLVDAFIERISGDALSSS